MRSLRSCRGCRARLGNRHRRSDQREVAEGLREVADLTLPLHVVLLCQKAEIVAQGDQSLEQLTRLTDPPVERQRADEPERAGEELSLVARQPVVRDGRRVAGDESVTAELARDRVDGVRDALVASGQEPD